jgi:hypothetical protein
MRKIILYALCVSLSLSALVSSAQTRRQAKDSSVTIIFSESARTPSSKKKSASGEDNIVKIAPLGFITGQFPLLYERRITDFLTVEIGGGITNRNYLRGAFVSAGEGDDASMFKEYPWSSSGSDYDVAEPLYSFDARKPAMGYLFRISPRIYFESEAPDGSFLGLQFNHATYNFTIPKYVSGAHTGAPQKEHETVTDFMVHFGHQWINDRITLESSSAIGLRKVKGEKYVASDSGIDGMATYEKSGINFGIGLTVGFHF